MTALKLIRTVVLTAVIATSMISLTACNTTEGVGKDVERTGEKMQDAADGK